MPPVNDTSCDAYRVQTELLRTAGTVGRFQRTCSITRTVVALSRQALRRRMPHLSEEEIGLAFVKLHYGPELADRVRQYLAARST